MASDLLYWQVGKGLILTIDQGSNSPPVFGIIGWKDSGKTTLVERLIEELTIRGYCISAIKHAHHAFDIDEKYRDSYKFRSAGARRTAIVSRNRWAMIHELRAEEEPPLEEIIDHVGSCDLILIEGYKRGHFNKIEVRNPALDKQQLASDDPHIVAIAFNGAKEETSLPAFHVDDISQIADFIQSRVGLSPPTP